MDDPSASRGTTGDRAIGGLWRQLREFVRSRVKPPAQADDIVQETWLRALQASPRDVERTQAWLRTVALHLILDEQRTRRRRADRERAVARSDRAPIADSELTARLERVGRCVEALREPYREVILLRYRDGHETAQIARRVGRSEGTVRSQLKRGLDLLRQRLGSEDADGKRRRALVLLPWNRSGSSHAGSTFSRTGVRRLTWAAAACVALLGAWLAFDVARRDAFVSSDAAVEIARAEHGSRDATDFLGDVAADPHARRTAIESALASPARELESRRVDSGRSVRGRVVLRTSGDAIAGATILAASKDLDTVIPVGVSDERGEFEVHVRDLPAWIWAEHENHAPTTRRLVESAYAASGRGILLDFVRTGRVQGVVVDADGQPVPGAHIAFGGARMRRARRDAHGLLDMGVPPIVTRADEEGRFSAPRPVQRRVRVQVRAEGFASRSTMVDVTSDQIRLELERGDATGGNDEAMSPDSLRDFGAAFDDGIVRARTAESERPTGNGSIRGSLSCDVDEGELGLELRLDGPNPDDSRSCAQRSGGGFEFAGLAPGRYVLSVEGGGAHGAWRAAAIDLAADERHDLGVLIAPPPGSVVVRAKPSRAGEKGPETLMLVGEGTSTLVHFRTQGLGIEYDRGRGRVSMRSVWPGTYRVILAGARIADATAECVIRSGIETALELQLEFAERTFIRVLPVRPLLDAEEWTLFLHSSKGTREVTSADMRFYGEANGELSFNLGIAPEVDRIEMRTSFGLAGECALDGNASEPRHVELPLE